MGKSTKGFSVGLISGVFFGSLIGMLYAPDKGINTRDRLSYQLNSYLVDISDLIEKLRHESQVSDAKKQGDLVVEEAQKKAEDLIAEAEKLLKDISGQKK
ncbi:MAG: YtxH domain-containing protein [Balneolales bacterium]